MAQINLKGNPIHTVGNLPKVASKAPDFKLTRQDLSDASLLDFPGKRLVLNIFPSLDTSTCATSVRKFNQRAANLKDTVVLCISRDLPFAQARFCTAEGIQNVVTLSELRSFSFGEDYGVRIADSPMAGLFSRAVVVTDKNGNVIYTEQVPEITQEPDYEKAIKALE